MMSSFKSLGVNECLQNTLLELGYKQPTQIQIQCFPLVMTGRDLMAESQTGTGKTAAFALPLLQRHAECLSEAEIRPIRSLILVPTRELAIQVEESFRKYSAGLGLRCAAVYGGVAPETQARRLKRGADLLVATPGRLQEMLRHQVFDLKGLETLVLDEADRMLDLGFIDDIRRLMRFMPKQRQTLLYSATFSGEIEKLARDLLDKPERITATKRNSAANKVQQIAYGVEQRDKAEILSYLIQGGSWKQVLVFVRTKKRVDMVTEHLQAEGIEAGSIHGDKSQRERSQTLERFKQGKLRVLVATDVAARGLDIDALPRVVNFDLPQQPEAYIHRIGRTGRANSSGQAISFVAPDEHKLVAEIEALMKRPLKLKPVPYFDNGVEMPAAALPEQGRRRKATKVATPKKPAVPEYVASDAPSVRPSIFGGGRKKR
ncbi:DEAD/DEAH box helicase [Marinobacterium jannaschii]|uniref:DEAD/DEAH box helicase n=1 Tax=Marinobacterium jannaschii TaxID=64970 RepID=UPI001FE0F396|nr:DEAD/DEAH box helicase [Marinobacterium jannaschii]